MTPSSDDQPEFSQMLLRMTEIWRNNMEQAGEVEKLWSNSMPMWNLDRQVYALMAAWMDVGPRLAAYHAIASMPWNKAYERYSATLADTEDAKGFGWRKAFEAWRAIADEELISNFRSEDFPRRAARIAAGRAGPAHPPAGNGRQRRQAVRRSEPAGFRRADTADDRTQAGTARQHQGAASCGRGGVAG